MDNPLEFKKKKGGVGGGGEVMTEAPISDFCT